MDPTWIVRLDVPGDGPRLAVKDCIDVEGLPTTAGCQVVAEQASPAVADAPVVAAARRAGAPNEYLLSRLDRLAPHNQRAITEAARITAEEAAEATQAR
jgi:hypothetical protein